MTFSWMSQLIPVYGFVALAIYISFLYVFAVNYKAEFRKYPFYLLVPWLAVGDICMLSLYSFYLVIVRFVDGEIEHRLNQAILYGSGMLLAIYMSVLMAINRFCVLLMPSLNDHLFSEINMKKTIFVTLIVHLAVIMTPSMLLGCHLQFDIEFGNIKSICNGTGRLPEWMWLVHHIMLWAYQLTPLYCGLLILVLYVICFVYLVRQRVTNSALGTANNLLRKAKERRLLYQGACIGLSLVMLDLAHLFAYKFPEGTVALIVVTNALVTPLTFMVFNKVIREWYLLRLGWVPKPNRVGIATTKEQNVTPK